MQKPASRLLQLLDLLQSRGTSSGTALAQDLGIDGRTLRRYIAQLEELGVPVIAGRGRHGGYSLIPGFRLPPLIFNNAEAVAVFLGLVLVSKLGIAGETDSVKTATSKLERVLPHALRKRGESIRSAIAMDLRPSALVSHGIIALLSEATQERLTVSLRYQSRANVETAREFDPYGLCYRGAGWYLAGFCHLRHGLRTLRLDRILKSEATTKHFQRPDAFDVAQFVSRSLASLPRSVEVQVLLKTTLDEARRQIFSMLGTLTLRDDGVLLVGTADDLAWFARQLLVLSCSYTIISPPQFRSLLLREAKTAIQRCS